MDSLIFSLLFTVAAAVIFLAAAAMDRKVAVTFALLGALYLGLDDLVTGLPKVLPFLTLPAANWNWSGKILAGARGRLPGGRRRDRARRGEPRGARRRALA